MTTAGLQAAFRDVMAAVCSPVSVVTTVTDGRPHGTTVSAFTSLPVDPPMVLVALDGGSNLLTAVRTTGRFGLNVLGSDQSALATTFARKGPDKFSRIAWELDGGVPRIRGAGAFLACAVAQLVSGGDHVIVLGTVHTADAVDVRPLNYHGRAFGTHTPVAPS